MNNVNKWEKTLFKIIEYGVYLALFSPLIVFKNYFFPFVVPKTIFFRIVVDIIFSAYIVLAILNPKYRPKITPLTLAVFVFLVILFLTSIFGVSFERSFWSVFERMTGLLTFLHLFAFYIVVASCFKERKYWERTLFVSVFVAVLIAFYALVTKEPTTRAGGTLGNSSFLSSYLLFNIFFAAVLMVLKSGVRRIVLGFFAAFLVFLLFFNPGAFTKGAVSSFAIGAVLFMTAFMFWSGRLWLRRLAPFFLIFSVLAGIFIVNDFYFQGKLEGAPFSLKNIPDKSRQMVWQMAFEGWKERPILGWGWENFNAPFAKYYNPALPLTLVIWYDRVHNIILDTAVTSGLVGLLSYFFIFWVAALALSRWAKANLLRPNELLISLLLMTMLLVYFLQNFWVFDMISSYIMFFLTLAFIGFLVYPKEKLEGFRTVPLSSLAGSLLIALAIIALFYGNIRPAQASREILKGVASSPEAVLPAFQRAFRLSPMAQFEGPEQLSFRMADLALERGVAVESLYLGFQQAEQEFKKAIKTSPLDLRLYLFLARHYGYFYSFTGERDKLNLMDEVLAKAIEISPLNQQVYFHLAQLRFFQKRQEEALEILRQAKALEPRYVEARRYLILGYKLAGEQELMMAEVKELQDMGLDVADIFELDISP